MTKPKILIVDDVKDNRFMLSMMLEDNYEVFEAESGNQCIEKIDDIEPDVVLLDVNMPGMNGYETCVALRKLPQYTTLPIIFVSAADTTEERLEGFEAGGDEYVTKPVDANTLLEKIQLRLNQRAEVNSAKENATNAMNIAMEAMTSSSELGQIISFVKDTQNISSVIQMAEKLSEIALEFALNSCVYIKGREDGFVGCEPGSMEAAILERSFISHDRVINLGVRTIVKGSHLSLLIKNMPIEDESKYGRFKDHMAVLVSIADGRIETLNTQQKMEDARKQLLDDVIKVAEDKLSHVGKKLENYDVQVREVMTDMVTNLEASLFKLGLEEDQEEALMALAYQATNKLEEASASRAELEESLNVVVEGLYGVRGSA